MEIFPFKVFSKYGHKIYYIFIELKIDKSMTCNKCDEWGGKLRYEFVLKHCNVFV